MHVTVTPKDECKLLFSRFYHENSKDNNYYIILNDTNYQTKIYIKIEKKERYVYFDINFYIEYYKLFEDVLRTFIFYPLFNMNIVR